jgi:hypothetical protein
MLCNYGRNEGLGNINSVFYSNTAIAGTVIQGLQDWKSNQNTRVKVTGRSFMQSIMEDNVYSCCLHESTV